MSFDTYKDFTKYLATRTCPLCDTAFIKDKKDVEELFRSWQKGECNSQVKCPSCSKSTCIACFEKSGGNATETTVQAIRVKWCCSRGRLFMIWVTLCGFDQAYSSAKRREASTTSRAPCTEKRSGVGYDTGAYDGYRSYVGPLYDENAEETRRKAQKTERAADSFDGSIFALLARMLPSPDGNTNFDIDPPEVVTSMLMNSKILNKAAELLRNDSLDNASKRKNLYNELLGFLRTIGAHETALKKLMFSEHESFPDAVNLLTLSFDGTPRSASKTSTSSLADLLRNLNIQSNVMMKGALKNEKEFNNQDGRDLLWLCRKISDLSSYLLGENQNPTLATDYGIMEVSDDQIYPTYYYYKKAKALRESPFGRIKSLITEITTLKTGLSSGIYVKHGSSRLDVMKFIIVGPEVVCLSLLGTFDGEQWRPGQSTILQVLISIQAMIFCEDPANNIRPTTGENDVWFKNMSFNQSIHGHTIKLGMLDWMRKPPRLWKDVVDLHFKRNGNKILQTVEKWAAMKQKGVGMYTPGSSQEAANVKKLLPDLQKALEKYGATYTTRCDGDSTKSSYGSGVGYGRYGGAYERSRRGY
ncbi:hypothetical protein CC80DRAFT_468788 [Byssothecium circinans]|uniref:Uncharacterized protein n=1 Tax=Byssothecium circinans TaxID=147558 RepID=A0A6A5U2M8_9PLEO|nr:hypothetical protein CC80DRAFT_468788 [Byssothecium circinans]